MSVTAAVATQSPAAGVQAEQRGPGLYVEEITDVNRGQLKYRFNLTKVIVTGDGARFEETIYRCGFFQKPDGTCFVQGPSYDNPKYKAGDKNARPFLRPCGWNDQLKDAITRLVMQAKGMQEAVAASV